MDTAEARLWSQFIYKRRRLPREYTLHWYIPKITQMVEKNKVGHHQNILKHYFI